MTELVLTDVRSRINELCAQVGALLPGRRSHEANRLHSIVDASFHDGQGDVQSLPSNVGVRRHLVSWKISGFRSRGFRSRLTLTLSLTILCRPQIHSKPGSGMFQIYHNYCFLWKPERPAAQQSSSSALGVIQGFRGEGCEFSELFLGDAGHEHFSASSFVLSGPGVPKNNNAKDGLN